MPNNVSNKNEIEQEQNKMLNSVFGQEVKKKCFYTWNENHGSVWSSYLWIEDSRFVPNVVRSIF